MSKELQAFRRICNNLNSYEFTDECKKNKKLIENAFKDYENLKERTKLDSFECLLRLEEILPRGKELLIPVAKELKRKQDLEQMLHKMNVKHGYEEYLKISKALEIIKSAGFSLEFDESQNEWFLHISARGTGIKIYELLKEVLK